MQIIELRLRLRGFALAVEPRQDIDLRPPARRQRRVAAAGPRIGRQRFLGPPHVAAGMAFLLVRPPVFGRQGLQLLEQRQRLVEFAPVTPADRAHVKCVGVVWIFAEEGFEVA